MATVLGDISLIESPSGTSVAVPYPAGIRAGEKLLAVLAGPSNTVATALPSGWTAYTSRAGNEVGANNAITVWERTATGTETGSVTLTGTGSAGRITGAIFRVGGLDAATAFDVAAVTGAQTSNTAYTSPTIVTSTADALVVHLVSLNAGATSLVTSAPGGLIQLATNTAPDNTTAGRRLHVYSEGRPTAGATGTRSWTQTTATQWTYVAIVFRQAASVSAPAEPTGPTGAWSSVFVDDFSNGTLDTTKWTALDNWSMNGVQAMARNVSVSGGNLLLTLESGSFGAAVSSDPNNSAGRYDVAVGDYVEALVYFPGDGSIVYNWPAFWTSGQTWPTNGEHDVAEVLSKQVAVNYHYGTAASPQQSGPWAQAGYWGNAWHVYGVHRKASTADVYWDGRLVRSYSTSDSGGGHTILLNVGVSGTPLITGAASQVRASYVKAWRPTVAAGVALTSSASSSAGAADTATRTLTAARSATDTAGATDAHTWRLSKQWSASSAAGATDSASWRMAAVRTIEDWAPVTDTVKWTIDRPDIENYQFVFDTEPWVPFGLGQTIVVENFNPGTAETRNQDVLSPTADVRWFGTDRRTPPTWSFDLYTDVEDAAQALGWVQNMEEIWDAEDLRSTPNAVIALRYKIADRIRRVYGRPGDFTPIPSYVRTGRMHMAADFRLAEHTYYDDTEDKITIRTIPSNTSASGFTFPITFPLTIGAQGDSPYIEQAVVRGKRSTWIDVTFYGPSLDPWVVIGGQRWQLRGELGAQESIRMSGKPWQTGLLRNDGAWMAGMLGPQARLSQLRLKPGNYPVKYGAYDPTGTSRAEVAWHAAYGTM